MAGSSNLGGIGARLRAARARAGATREELAVRSGISWSAITQIELGRRTNIRPSTLSALAGALGVTIDYLVSGTAPRTPMLDHRALLYATASEFSAAVVPFLDGAIENSEAVLAVTSQSAIRGLRRQLGARASQVEFADHAVWYTTPAAALGSYREFLDRSTNHGATWVRILGEPAQSHTANGNGRPRSSYEALVNLVFSCAPLSMLCPYDTTKVHPKAVEHARATHPYTVAQDAVEASQRYLDPETLLLEE